MPHPGAALETVKAILLQLTEQLEQARARWHTAAPATGTLQSIYDAIAALRAQLRRIGGEFAANQEQRWARVQDAIEEAQHWEDVVAYLSEYLDAAAQDIAAGPIDRLSTPARERATDMLGDSEWLRLRGWWRGYLDTLADDWVTNTAPASLSRAHHRVYKARNRAFRHNGQSDWLKLKEAATALLEALTAHAAAGTDIVHYDAKVAECEAVIRSLADWQRVTQRAHLLKLLAKAPELDPEVDLLDLLDQRRMQSRLQAHRHLEAVRDILTGASLAG